MESNISSNPNLSSTNINEMNSQSVEYKQQLKDFDDAIKSESILSGKEINSINLNPQFTACEILLGVNKTQISQLIPSPKFYEATAYDSPIKNSEKLNAMIAELSNFSASPGISSNSSDISKLLENCKKLSDLSSNMSILRAKVIGNSK